MRTTWIGGGSVARNVCEWRRGLGAGGSCSAGILFVGGAGGSCSAGNYVRLLFVGETGGSCSAGSYLGLLFVDEAGESCSKNYVRLLFDGFTVVHRVAWGWGFIVQRGEVSV